MFSDAQKIYTIGHFTSDSYRLHIGMLSCYMYTVHEVLELS